MGFLPTFLSFATIAILIGLPILIFIQLFQKRYVYLKVPSLKIWSLVIKFIGAPPKVRLKIFSISFLLNFILLCVLALLCSSPIYYQKKIGRPNLVLVVNRSTSMGAKSGEYSSRWARVQKTLYNHLIEAQYRPDDSVVLLFNPPLHQEPIETMVGQIDNYLIDSMLVDMPPSNNIFYQLDRFKGKIGYVSDSYEEVPDILQDKISLIYVQDQEHVNVGWVKFWVEEQTVYGVIENFSNFALNINIDLKLNGVSAPIDDFAPAIPPNGLFFFQKKIDENMDTINLIEATIACPGDCLEADNTVGVSRLNLQQIKVLLNPDVPLPMQKFISALGDKINLTIGQPQINSGNKDVDIYISKNYNAFITANQILVHPDESTQFYKIFDKSINGEVGLQTLFKNLEGQIFKNVTFEQIHEIREEVTATKLLQEEKTLWPLISRWKIIGSTIYLLNFDCSEKSTLANTVAFPFLLSMIIDEMNLNRFLSFKTGQTLNYYDLVNQSPKVFQTNRQNALGKIDFQFEDNILLKRTGVYSNENHNLCVNLLDEKESNIKQKISPPHQFQEMQLVEMVKPLDLRPYIFLFILFLIIIEWLFARKNKE